MPVRIALVLCVAIGVLLVGVPKAGAAATVVRNGSGDSEFSLSGVSCPSSSDCMGVGSYAARSGASVPFAEQWNGTSWRAIPISAPEFSELTDVTCVDTSDCMAVGSTRYGTLAEIWDGNDWRVAPALLPKARSTANWRASLV